MKRSICSLSLLLSVLLGTVAHGASRSSGPYAVAAEILDSGGGAAASAAYTQAATSIGITQGNQAGATAGQAAGYLAQVTGGLAYQSAPEIAVEQPSGAANNLAAGGSHSLGMVALGSSADTVFTVRNFGFANLLLTGSSARVVVSGADAAQFSLVAAPTASVFPGGSTGPGSPCAFRRFPAE